MNYSDFCDLPNFEPSYSAENEDQMIERFLPKFFTELYQIRGLEGSRFVKINGRVIKICEDISDFEILCPHCFKNTKQASNFVDSNSNKFVFDPLKKYSICSPTFN